MSHSPECKKQFSQKAFSRTDLLTVIVLGALFGGLLAYFLTQDRNNAKGLVCANNLRLLGITMSLFAPDNQGKLPYAFIHYSDKQQITWDQLVMPYVSQVANSGPTDNQTNAPPDYRDYFLCPADETPIVNWAKRLRRRTYAMSKHNMRDNNWPPSSENTTGVGIWWASYVEKTASPRASIASLESHDDLPAVKLSMITSPKKTLLLTEFPLARNILGNSSGAVVVPVELAATNGWAPFQEHRSRFNYLMIDGHVQALPMIRSNTPQSKIAGMWTIKNGD